MPHLRSKIRRSARTEMFGDEGPGSSVGAKAWGGFRVNITQEQIENAPKYEAGSDYDWSPENTQRIDSYYSR